MRILPRLIVFGFAAGTLFGCDASTDTLTPDAAVASTESYVYDNGLHVRVIVDAEFAPERATFASLDAYHEHLEQLDEAGAIPVNAVLWERLRHANDPAEVSVLGASGTVIVAEHLYEVGPEAIYRTPLSSTDGKKELVHYYGLSGTADLDEFVLAVAAFNGVDVDASSLRNPFAKDLVVLAANAPHETQNLPTFEAGSRNPSCTYLGQSNSVDRAECFVGQVSLPDMSAFLPSTYSTAGGNYDVRINVLNQSYRKVFKKKAYGNTHTSVRRAGSNDEFFGLGVVNGCPGYIVQFPPTAPDYGQFRGYFSNRITLEGSTSAWSDCVARRTTDRSGGAESYHDAQYRAIGYSFDLLDRYFLP